MKAIAKGDEDGCYEKCLYNRGVYNNAGKCARCIQKDEEKKRKDRQAKRGTRVAWAV
jgi:hypothetical protein